MRDDCAKVAVRAPWAHMAGRARRKGFSESVRAAIFRAVGFDDEVIYGMVQRHVRRARVTCPRRARSADARACTQLERSEADGNFSPDELTWLVAVLVGADAASDLVVRLVDLLEDGLETSWYDAKLRKKFGGVIDS